MVHDDDPGHPSPIQLCEAWVLTKKEPTLLVWQAESSIERQLADAVQEELADVSQPYDRLWVWLNSDGGDLDAAYQITRALRRAAKEVIAVIPRWAKSATTMIVVGCHEIVMHPMAELGPLDAQVIVRRHHSRRYGSTLDTHHSVDFLRMFAADSFMKLAEKCMKKFQVDEATAGRMAGDALTAMFQPIFAQVDPGEMGEHQRLLAMADEYGRRLMTGLYSSKDIDRILDALISGYPAHSFVVDFDEAKALGLRVRLPTVEEMPVLRHCAPYFGRCALHHQDFVELVTMERIAAAALAHAGPLPPPPPPTATPTPVPSTPTPVVSSHPATPQSPTEAANVDGSGNGSGKNLPAVDGHASLKS